MQRNGSGSASEARGEARVRQNFGDMWLCFVSLFRVATLDNWATMLYIAMYGCDNYGCSGRLTRSPARRAHH